MRRWEPTGNAKGETVARQLEGYVLGLATYAGKTCAATACPRPPSAAPPIITATPAKPSATPIPRAGVSRSSAVSQWATRTAKIGVVALRNQARPATIAVGPKTMRRGGRAYWQRTAGHPPHPEARYLRRGTGIPTVRRRKR